jgi:hypothetical protein
MANTELLSGRAAMVCSSRAKTDDITYRRTNMTDPNDYELLDQDTQEMIDIMEEVEAEGDMNDPFFDPLVSKIY